MTWCPWRDCAWKSPVPVGSARLVDFIHPWLRNHRPAGPDVPGVPGNNTVSFHSLQPGFDWQPGYLQLSRATANARWPGGVKQGDLEVFIGDFAEEVSCYIMFMFMVSLSGFLKPVPSFAFSNLCFLHRNRCVFSWLHGQWQVQIRTLRSFAEELARSNAAEWDTPDITGLRQTKKVFWFCIAANDLYNLWLGLMVCCTKKPWWHWFLHTTQLKR